MTNLTSTCAKYLRGFFFFDKLLLVAFLFFIQLFFLGNATAQSFPNPASLSTGQGLPNTIDPLWLASDWYATYPPNPMGLNYIPTLINNNCAPGNWVNPASLPAPVNNGNWITGSDGNCATNTTSGYRYFRLTLDLPSDCNGNSVAIAGTYVLDLIGYVDNTISDVFINGNSTGISGGGYAPGSQLNIHLAGPWVPGTNYVDILVYNFPNPPGGSNPYGLLMVADPTVSSTTDTDGDGVPDLYDLCPCQPGNNPLGCIDPVTNGCDLQAIRNAFTAAGCVELFGCMDQCSMYFLNPNSLSGSQAQAFAQNLGANLISVQSAAENQCVIDKINDLGYTGVIWIGFNDEAVEGTFEWYDQSPVTYTNWAPGEPNQSGNEDCVQIYPGGANPGTWNDLSCNSANAKSIIEVNLCPVLDAGTDVTICIGATANLNASNTLFGSSPYTYLWDNGVNVQSNPVSPTTTSNYNVVTVDRYSCTGSDDVTVNVNPLPVVNAGTDVAICIGQSVTLSGSGAVSYLWNNSVTNGIAFFPTVTTTYTVTGTDANGCVNTDQVTVTVNPLPAINAGIDQAICINDPVTVLGSGGVSYVWDNSVLDGTAFNPTVTTTYTVTGTDVNGCVNTDQMIVSINPLPAINAGIDQTICINDPITLSGSGGVSYVWDNSVIDGIAFNPTVTTTYTVTGTDVNGCVNTDELIVTINQLPLVDAGIDQVICNNHPVTLSGSGAATYVWDNSVIDGAPFNPTATTTFTVTGTDLNGCVNTDQVIVTINSLPPVDAGIDQTICINDPVILSGSGALNYVWDNSVVDGTAFNPTVTTIYTVTGTDANGCFNTDQMLVTVNPLPVIDAGIDQTICINDAVTLSGSGAATYVWDNSVTDGITFNPTVTAIYTVSGTDANGCVNTDQVLVIVNPLPVVNAGIDQTICINDPVSLSGSGAVSYVWDNSVVDGTAFNPTSTITYKVTGTDANGCVNTDLVTVIVNPLPVVDAGIDQAVCLNDAITLSGSGAVQYVWDNSLSDGVAFNPTITTTYTVTGTDANGCVNSDQVTVIVNPLPVVDFEAGEMKGCVPMKITYTSIGNYVNCEWQFGDGETSTGCGSIVHTYNDPGCFSVTLKATSSDGCVNEKITNNIICIPPNPIADFGTSAGYEALNMEQSSIDFFNYSSNANSYLWSFGTGDISSETSPSYTYPNYDAGEYKVRLIAYNALGCSDTAYTDIVVEESLIYYVPNAFTPNGDQHNQTFKPVFTAGFDPTDYNMFIYNRWGELIFESRDAEFGWDGTYEGDSGIVQDGIYTWRIDFKLRNSDKRIAENGHVTLVR